MKLLRFSRVNRNEKRRAEKKLNKYTFHLMFALFSLRKSLKFGIKVHDGIFININFTYDQEEV